MHTLQYTLTQSDGNARAGVLTTRRGEIPTPVFMPVGTQATVKALSQNDLRTAGARIILGNTYHLLVRSDPERIDRMGGLHGFMSWDRSILTDSGGFQVFSLGDLNRITEDGVRFRSHHDGTEYLLTPESSIRIQHDLGADIIMAFDQCPPYPSTLAEVVEASERSVRWAARSLVAHYRENKRRPGRQPPALFAILQGGVYPWLRQEQARLLSSFDFPGYALGGLSVGEPKDLMWEVLDAAVPLLPWQKPRYLMGVGYPEDLVDAVARGIDMFDCVIPTRNARRGAVFTQSGTLSLKNARFTDDSEPIDTDCPCETCREYSRAYLHHLIRADEILGMRLCTLHNVTFYQRLTGQMREAILEGCFEKWRRQFLSEYLGHA